MKFWLKIKKNHNAFISFFCLISFILLMSPLTISATTLDTKGDWSATCSAGTLSSHVFDRPNLKATYSFKGQCVESSGSNVTNRWYQIKAGWNGSTKTANEDLSVTFWNGYYAGSIIYSCPDDPWLNNVNCTVTGKAGDIFKFFQGGNNPISAGFVSASQKQSLKSEWNQQAVFPTAQAPVIMSPSPNQAFMVPAKVQIKVQHTPNYGVSFEFQWCPFNKPNTPPGFFITKNLTPVNLKTNAGVTTAEVTINEVGKWRLRSQSIFPNAPWSGWTEFKVDTINDAIKMSPGLKDQMNFPKPSK
jgi:hypothetical protein